MWKIFSARWLTRAWCCHELRVNKQQLFLISFKSGLMFGHKVPRTTPAFLHDMGLDDIAFAFDPRMEHRVDIQENRADNAIKLSCVR